MNLFESMMDCAKSFPDAPAQILQLEEGLGFSTITYGELWKKSDALAAYLAAKYPRGQSVIVLGGKTHESLISFLACTKSGRPYIPIDPKTPFRRLQDIANCAVPAGIINLSSFGEDQIGIDGIEYISVDSLNAIFEADLPYSDWHISGDEVYYVIFTSGSTGIPKGVQITYNNLEDFVTWTVDAYGYSEKKYFFLDQAPYSFDLSVYEIYNSLATGGCLLSINNERVFDLKELVAVLGNWRFELEIFVATPSFLSLCISASEFVGTYFQNIKQFVLIGEVFPKSLASITLERFPSSIVSNFYGPTEATVAATVFDVDAESLSKYESIPIGKTKPRSKVLIIDDEIILCGPNVSPGYLNDLKKTNECFFEHNGIKAYRTGDMGMFDENQLLFYRGRKDLQIKLNGYRIEIGDIEMHLNRIDFIINSCVVPQYHHDKVQMLCAFLILRSDCKQKNFSKIDLRKCIKNELERNIPQYMVPKKIIIIDEMPMTVNGKIDRQKLMEVI